MKATMITLHSV